MALIISCSSIIDTLSLVLVSAPLLLALLIFLQSCPFRPKELILQEMEEVS
jgi:hypothetical protein